MVEQTSRQKRKEFRILLVFLVVLGIALVVTTIRGPFIIDEINYLVTVTGLRAGTLFVPGTEGLTPSKELYSFDPEPYGRIASRTPVFSVAPPIALPFSFLGWRGLVLLNTISFLLTALLVFALVRQVSANSQTAWYAAAFVLIGGYSLEYSQGLWPHMLSVFLVVAAVTAASKVWQGGDARYAIVSGLLVGLATGVREQNIVLAVLLGLTLLLFSPRRLHSAVLYGVGVSVPLIAGATLHYFRQGLWHPFPKAVAFSGQLSRGLTAGATVSPLQNFWARVVDFSAFPSLSDPHLSLLYKKDLVTGVVLVGGVVKKALLQSSPWMLLALVILALSWVKRDSYSNEVKRSLRSISLLVLPLLLFFSIAGGARTDGLAYNQRYFLEIIPLAAIALALALDGIQLPVLPAIFGLMGSGILYAMTMMLPSRVLYELALLKLPLVFSLLAVAAWMNRTHAGMRSSFMFLMGLCVGWSLFVHVFEDLSASRARRSRNAAQLEVLESTIPDRSALFAYWGSKDVAGALHVDRDVVVLDVAADEGADADRLARELRLQNRRIFVLTDVFPETVLREIVRDDSLVVRSGATIRIEEVVQRKTQ